MRIATYNVEWFNALFDDDGMLLLDDRWSSRRDVTRAQQIEALATVFRALDADAIVVVEAPDVGRNRGGAAALQRFAAFAEIRASQVCMGFANDTQQEIMLLYDPDVVRALHAPTELGAPQFDKEFRIDLDVDATEDLVRFSKPPLEVALETPVGALRLIGCHVKSKAPHGARDATHAMQLSIANRRKQLAQCIWLRARVAAHLAAGDQVIVAGDLNDGPGLDEYEALFGRSGLEIVMGAEAPLTERLYDPHAARALGGRMAATPTTARFFLRNEGRFLQALLDYILVSRDLREKAQGWRIWHPFDDPRIWADTGLREALLAASDHFPVSLDLE